MKFVGNQSDSGLVEASADVAEASTDVVEAYADVEAGQEAYGGRFISSDLSSWWLNICRGSRGKAKVLWRVHQST